MAELGRRRAGLLWRSIGRGQVRTLKQNFRRDSPQYHTTSAFQASMKASNPASPLRRLDRLGDMGLGIKFLGHLFVIGKHLV